MEDFVRANAFLPWRYSRRALLGGAATLLALAVAGARSALAQSLDPGSLTGSWAGQEAYPLGTMQVSVLFFANGSYQRSHVIGPLMTWDKGRFSVVQNWIHFELEEFGPETFNGRPMHPMKSDTWMVTGFDGARLTATIGAGMVTVTRQ